MSHFCQVWLTCRDEEEASKIANALLVKCFVACSKQFSVTSDFAWQGRIDRSKEVLLVMDSRIDLLEEIEIEVAKIRSYATFVLQTTPIDGVSREAQNWHEKVLVDAKT